MKNILISGASSGFGEAVARRFSSDGHRLILLARRRERLSDLANELGGAKKCQFLCADVRNNEELESSLSALPEDFKNIDILKIDAEGYEYNILKGINNLDFRKIRFIYFEHHYDLMIKKGYKFSQINKFLNKKNFFKK